MKVDFDTRMEWLCWIAYNGMYSNHLLKILRPRTQSILADDFLWQDLVLRHGFDGVRPWNAQEKDDAAYDHALGNFWGMISSMKP